MQLLSRYILKNNFTILVPTLLVSIGIFLLIDIFERIDLFEQSKISIILLYFGLKIPSIVAQILPAVFLLACVIQLCLLAKNRELLAIWAGGISNFSILINLIICAVFWTIIQFSFSQYIGVKSDIYASQIWDNEIQKNEVQAKILNNIWFAENNLIVNIQTINSNGHGTNLSAYVISNDQLNIEKIIRAKNIYYLENELTLYEVNITEPNIYKTESIDLYNLNLQQNINYLFATEYGFEQLPIWSLGEVIKSLENSGSNVEALKTAWHTRLAYSFSLIVMAFIAMTIISYKQNIFIAAGFAIIITFLFYIAFSFAGTLGNLGTLTPITAAWITNISAMCLSLFRLVYKL